MNTMLRRRIMIANSGEPPEPPTPVVPSYELESPTTTQNYDTGVKLFDTAKDFTILCQATYNNYGWNDTWKEGIFGIVSGTKNANFKLGSLDNLNDYQSGTLSATANRYTALVLNKTASNKRGTSLVGRTGGDRTDKFFVRYDSSTRKVEAGSSSLPTSHYYTVDGDYSTTNTLKLLIGGATGTVSIFKVYDSLLTDAQINAFFV